MSLAIHRNEQRFLGRSGVRAVGMPLLTPIIKFALNKRDAQECIEAAHNAYHQQKASEAKDRYLGQTRFEVTPDFRARLSLFLTHISRSCVVAHDFVGLSDLQDSSVKSIERDKLMSLTEVLFFGGRLSFLYFIDTSIQQNTHIRG